MIINLFCYIKCRARVSVCCFLFLLFDSPQWLSQSHHNWLGLLGPWMTSLGWDLHASTQPSQEALPVSSMTQAVNSQSPQLFSKALGQNHPFKLTPEFCYGPVSWEVPANQEAEILKPRGCGVIWLLISATNVNSLHQTGWEGNSKALDLPFICKSCL